MYKRKSSKLRRVLTGSSSHRASAGEGGLPGLEGQHTPILEGQAASAPDLFSREPTEAEDNEPYVDPYDMPLRGDIDELEGRFRSLGAAAVGTPAGLRPEELTDEDEAEPETLALDEPELADWEHEHAVEADDFEDVEDIQDLEGELLTDTDEPPAPANEAGPLAQRLEEFEPVSEQWSEELEGRAEAESAEALGVEADEDEFDYGVDVAADAEVEVEDLDQDDFEDDLIEDDSDSAAGT